MRLTMDRRLTVALRAAACALAGCDGKPKDGGTEGTTTGAGGSGGGPAVVAAGAPSARQAADAFLNDLRDGNMVHERVTTRFQETIAPPFVRPDGKKADPSPPETENWFGQFKGASFTVGEEAKFGNAIALRGLAKFPDKSQAFSLRMVKDGNDYKVDWLHRSERQSSPVTSPADPDLAAAQDVVRNFLDMVLGGDARQTHALMAGAWKKSLAPGDSDMKEGYDYSRGFLDRKIRSWKGEYLGYALAPGELGPAKNAATFRAELDVGGTKVPFTVKARKDPAAGQWLVYDFERQ